MTDYIEKNKQLWNERTQWHVGSKMYDVPEFLQGRSTLNEIELDLLGDVNGKSLIHLQCHFGMDTLSLARIGATVTGIDFSEAAIEEARKLANETNTHARFVCCNVYDAADMVQEKFDVVFTSYGVIGWLPDLHKWAAVIARLLKPGGIFVFAEFHPVVWMYDNDFTKVAYSYFKSDAIVELEQGTYADRSATVKTGSVTWNHSLAEVLNALLENGLTLQKFREFNYSPYACFLHNEEVAKDRYIIPQFGDKVPLVYALKAVNRHTVGE